MPRPIKGIGKLRRLMKQLPDATAQEIVVELNVAGRETLSAMQGLTRRRSGRLLAGLSMKVFPKTLRLQVGILGKAQRRKLFYAQILDGGRAGKTVQVRRSNGGGEVSSYTLNVKPMAATRFISGRKAELQSRLGRDLNPIYERGLRRAAAGSGGDD